MPGSGVIERVEEKWPKVVVLRLRLKGLESFQASNGKVTLQAAGVRDGKPEVRVWKDGKEDTPLNEQSPYWMTIHILGRDGKPAREIPLKDGYFEITLPRAFFEDNPKSV